MSKKNKYTELCQEMISKVQSAGGSRCSEGDRLSLMHTMLNTPDHEAVRYMKDNPDEEVTTTPVKEYRDSLKPVLKQFGVDDAEMDKIQEVEFPKKHAKAVLDLADTALKDYLDIGRKYILPITKTDEHQMEIYKVHKDEKSEETRKPVEVSPGQYESVPTGERRITKPHWEMKVSNKPQAHLVRKEKI